MGERLTKDYRISQAQQFRARLAHNYLGFTYGSQEELIRQLWNRLYENAWNVLKAASHEHLGKIACAAPKVTFLLFPCGISSGHNAVLQLATWSIISGLGEILWEEHQKEKEAPLEPTKIKNTLVKVYGSDDKPGPQILLGTLDASKSKAGDSIKLDTREYIVMETELEIDDPRFVDPIDVITVKKKADQ